MNSVLLHHYSFLLAFDSKGEFVVQAFVVAHKMEDQQNNQQSFQVVAKFIIYFYSKFIVFIVFIIFTTIHTWPAIYFPFSAATGKASNVLAL